MSTDKALAVGCGALIILGFPGYMGWAGYSFGTFVAYALVAGPAMATADRLAVSDNSAESASALFQHAILRSASVVVVGGLIYALALLAF